MTGLTVEHRANPVGMDAVSPRFGWQMESSVRGQRQSGYQILVATSPDRLTPTAADAWNSGRVSSSDAVAVTYDGKPLQASTRYFWTVWVWDKDGKAVRNAPTAFFETGLMSADGVAGWQGARWVSMAGKEPNMPGAPMLRREFTLTGDNVRDARLYISALGVYDAYVNGQRLSVPQGNGRTYELLPPGWTNYDTTVNYMTYEVTDLVAENRDVTLAAVLGNGWYNGRISAATLPISNGSAYYSPDGNPLALKAKLLIRYTDGSSDSFVTEPGKDWRATDTGPYIADDIYDGQTYDARKEMPGWNDSGFDASDWAGVVEHSFTDRFPDSRLVAYPGETARIVPEWSRHPQSITVYDDVAGEEASENGKGHIVVDAARSVTDPARAADASVTLRTGDTAVYDLGQNMVGVPSYTVHGPEGARVELRFGEMLNDDSAGADGPEGSVYRANLETAKATSTYVVAGDGQGETHQDSLSFYGFRYAEVKVTSPDTTVTVEDLVGKVATSALRDTGQIDTDDPMVDQLFSNVRWGQRGNYLWVPTDCPQRDERQGWTGDTQVFVNTGLYNGGATNFLAHFEEMLIESQATYGEGGAQYPATAPGGAFDMPHAGLSGWSDAGVVVPWTVWQMTGDTTIIDRSWESMTKYLDWIYSRTGETWTGQGATFGDWLAPQETSAQFMSDAYYAYSTKLFVDMAEATGRAADATEYADRLEKIRRAFMATYIVTNPITGKITVLSGLGEGSRAEPGAEATRTSENDSQTGLLWVLKLGFFDGEAQRRQLVRLLADNIGNGPAYQAAHPTSTRLDYAENTLSVGFLGVNVLAPVLTDNGRSDLAYTLLHQDAMPSWMYSVKNGATTVWERWNSYSSEEGFGPVEMNSFNHYSYGAIVEWMYEDMAGIAGDPEQPGFKHFFLQPQLDPTGRINHVAASHESPYGEIVSDWTRNGEELAYDVVVPANSRATLRIPSASPASVKDGSTALAQASGATFLGFENGVASYLLESGSYHLTSALR